MIVTIAVWFSIPLDGCCCRSLILSIFRWLLLPQPDSKYIQLFVTATIWFSISFDGCFCRSLVPNIFIWLLLPQPGSEYLQMVVPTAGLVQEPTGQVEEAWTSPHQCQLRLQQRRLRTPVQRADAALPWGELGGLRLLHLQQLGRQGPVPFPGQELRLGAQHAAHAQPVQVQWVHSVHCEHWTLIM